MALGLAASALAPMSGLGNRAVVWALSTVAACQYSYGYGSIPINNIFSGMNIHLPAILMFTRGTRF